MKKILLLAAIATIALGEANYYEEVGVSKDATSQEINGACRKALFKYHPDKGGDKAKFQEINNACEILRDDSKRSEYDQSLAIGQPSAAGNRVNTLTIEPPASEEKKGWLETIKAKVQGVAKGKEEKVINLVGDQLTKINIPDQAKTVFNQELALKNLAFTKAPSGPEVKAGLGFTGTMQLNQFQVQATVYAILDKKNNKQVSLEVDLPDQYKLSDMFPSLKSSVIDKLKMPKGRFVLTTIDYTSKEWEVKTGFNFAAILDLSGPVQLLDDLRKRAVSMPGVVAEGGQATIGGLIPPNIKDFELKATIPLKLGVDFTKISKVPSSVSDVFKRIATEQFYVVALPAKTKLEAGGEMKLVLGTQPDPLLFVIQGSVEKQLITIAGNMNGMLELKWAALGDLGVQIDIDEALLPVTASLGIPFTGLGLRGKLDLGKKGASRANLNASAKVSIKSSDIPDLVIDVEGTNLRLDDFIVFMSQVAAKQGVASKPIPSDKMPTLNFRQVKGYLATADAEIGTKTYKRGLSVDTDAQILSQEIKLEFFLDPEPKNLRMTGKAFLSPMDLKVIKLSGGGCPDSPDKGACMQFDFQATKPQESMLYVDGHLEIPKLEISNKTKLEYAKEKFNASVDTMIQDSFGAGFTLGIDKNKLDEFEAAFRLKADFAQFLNGFVLEQVRNIKSTAEQKASEADAKWRAASNDWNNFNNKVNAATAELNKHRADVAKHRADVTRLQAQVSQAKAQVDAFWKVEEAKQRCENTKAECANESNIAKKGICYAKIPFSSCTEFAAKAVGRAITRGEFNTANAVLSGYKNATKAYEQATKAADAAKSVFEAASRELNKANKVLADADLLRKSTSLVVGTFEKLVQLIGQGAQIINLKQAEGSVSGADLKAGKLPKLAVLEIAIQIPSGVPKIGGQGRSFVLRNVQFDFKNPKTSTISIAKAVAEAIKGMVK